MILAIELSNWLHGFDIILAFLCSIDLDSWLYADRIAMLLLSLLFFFLPSYFPCPCYDSKISRIKKKIYISSSEPFVFAVASTFLGQATSDIPLSHVINEILQKNFHGNF